MCTHFLRRCLCMVWKVLRTNWQPALITMPWHLPSAPETLCAKPKLPRKLPAEGWKPSYYFGYQETLFTNAPSKSRVSLKPLLEEQPEALWVFAGVGDMAGSTLSLHGNLSHTARRTPRSQLPHKQLAGVRTGLHLSFDPRTFLQWVDAWLTALPKLTGPPPNIWAPQNRFRWTTC